MPHHLLRQHFIGGSDDRTIMGDDEGALLRLWREKRGELEPLDLSCNLLVQLGLAAKNPNRSWYQANGGQALTEIERHIRHPALRWNGGHRRGHGSRVRGHVHAAVVALEEAVAEKYMAQLQHNMWVVFS
jgi:hypothetical protein